MIFAPALQTSGPSKNGSLRWSNWYLTGLKVAASLLLVLLIVLFWLLHQNETEEQRSTLIADVLWLEQAVNFHLEANVEQVQQLGAELAHGRSGGSLFELRANYLLKNNPDLQQLIWLNATADVIDSMPNQKLPRLGYAGLDHTVTGKMDAAEAAEALATASLASQARSIEMARKLGKTVYSDAYRTAASAQFEVYSPFFENGHYRGVLISVYSLDSLLQHIVPWWFAEKYQVRILDGNSALLARKSKVDDVATNMSYAIPFDPPGYGMVLQVAAYRAAGSLPQKLVTALSVALAAAMLLSLWVMRGHIKRRLAAEQALRAEHAFRKAMEDSLTVGMRARDLEGVVTYANPAFCQMVGYTAEELISAQPPMPFWAPEELEKAQLFHRAVSEGQAPTEGFELRFMRKDGSRFDALIYEAPLIDADGQQTGWMASIVDVTTRKQAEELARQQQEKLQLTSRLITMGEMASTLAHELNQPLAAITSYNTGCLNKLASGDFSTDELQTVLGKLALQAQRAGRIVGRVHDFVRKSEPKLATCDLAEVVEDSIGFIEADAKLGGTCIVRDIAEKRPLLMADRAMLVQVLLNLMRNGIEAMRATPPAERALRIVLRPIEGHLELRVIDRSEGIPPAVKEKLFTPFFSTKSEGMGMGLNICRSIVEFHHGRLWVEDNPDGGSIFAISLPVGES